MVLGHAPAPPIGPARRSTPAPIPAPTPAPAVTPSRGVGGRGSRERGGPRRPVDELVPAVVASAVVVIVALAPLVPGLLRIDPTHAVLAALHATACAIGVGIGVHRRCRPCLLVASVFPYCWLVVPSVFQIDHAEAAWADPGVTLDFGATVTAQGVLVLAQVTFLTAYVVGSRVASRSRPASGQAGVPQERLDPVRCRRLLLLATAYLLAALVLTPVLVSLAGGLSALTTSREDVLTALESSGLPSDDDTLGSLVRIAPSSFTVAAAVLALWVARAAGRGTRARWLAVAVSIASTLLLAFSASPLVSPRFLVLAAFGAVALALLRPRGRVGAMAVLAAALVTLLLVYPAADYFRYGQTRVTGLPLLASPDFDGFQQMINTVHYVATQGTDHGLHLLSGLFFVVPRSLWAAKTRPTTFDVAGARGYDFLDLSTPLPAEAYLALGWLGVVLLLALIGLAWAHLDGAWLAQSRLAVLAAYVAVGQVGLWRGPFGSLSGVIGSTVLLLAAGVLVTAGVRPGSRPAAEPGPGGPSSVTPEPRTRRARPSYPRPVSPRPRRPGARTVGRWRWADVGLGAGVLAAVVLATLAVVAPGGRETGSGEVAAGSGLVAGAGVGADETARDDRRSTAGQGSTVADGLLEGRIRAALDTDVVPALTPPVSELGTTRWYADARRAGCVTVDLAEASRCLFGPRDAPTTTVLLGDTAAVSYLPAVRGALATGMVQQLTRPGCTPLVGEGGPCEVVGSAALARIDRLDPDLVLIASTSASARRALPDDVSDAEALTATVEGLAREVEAVSAPGRIVAVLAEPPGAGDLTACTGPGRTAQDCEGSIDDDRVSLTDTERSAVEAAGASYIDTDDWFCVEHRCPAFVGTTPVYADGVRVSLPYARGLTDVVRDALVEVVGAR